MTNLIKRNARRAARVLALGFAGAMLASCTPVHVDLGSIPPPSKATSVSAPRNAPAISIARPTGPGPNTAIGAYDNGQIPIIVNTDPSLWVANALANRLQQAGYRVERIETLASAETPIALTIDVKEVSCNRMGAFVWNEFHTRVIAQIRVFKTGSIVLQRTYAGTWIGSKEPDKYELGVWAENNLNEALTNFLNQAVPDLTAFLARADQTASGAPAGTQSQSASISPNRP